MSERVLEPLFTLMIAELTGDALIAASYWSEVEMNYGGQKDITTTCNTSMLLRVNWLK